MEILAVLSWFLLLILGVFSLIGLSRALGSGLKKAIVDRKKKGLIEADRTSISKMSESELDRFIHSSDDEVEKAFKELEESEKYDLENVDIEELKKSYLSRWAKLSFEMTKRGQIKWYKTSSADHVEKYRRRRVSETYLANVEAGGEKFCLYFDSCWIQSLGTHYYFCVRRERDHMRIRKRFDSSYAPNFWKFVKAGIEDQVVAKDLMEIMSNLD